MKNMFSGAMAGLAAIACVLSATPAAAQNWRDRDHHDNRGDRGDNRGDRHDDRGDRRGDNRGDRHDFRADNRGDRGFFRGDRRQRWNTYGGRYGYDGYRGRWREGQRFDRWHDRRYYVNDWGRYGLPAPRRGYRYYRDDNGDIVMAAVATGVIGLILGSQLGR